MRISKDPEVRKKEIMEKAKELFIKDGYSKTSVDNLMKEVGVAKGLFYYYFKSKDALLETLEDDFMENFHEGLNSILNKPHDNIAYLLSDFIEYYFDTIEKNIEFISLSQGFRKNGKSLEIRLKETARSSALLILKDSRDFFSKNLTYPEHTINVLISGFSDLYLQGMKDKKIFLTIVQEILNIEI